VPTVTFGSTSPSGLDAGFPEPKLFPITGLRSTISVTAITELAECQASDQTITAVAGHVSPRMLAHYSHVCLEAKRSALESISGSRSKWKSERGQTKGYDTNNDTKSLWEVPFSPQVLDKNGGVDGTRTRGLCRDRLFIPHFRTHLQVAGIAV